MDRLNTEGCKVWEIEVPTTPNFSGQIRNPEKGGRAIIHVVSRSQVISRSDQEDPDTCLLSNLPIMGGLYDVQGKSGIYYEILIRQAGVIAIGSADFPFNLCLQAHGTTTTGTACRPYPQWRLPGWNRLSAGLHLDDCRKFFEDPAGGRDYAHELTSVSNNDTIGCGYEFATATLFFTHNGGRLPPAFTGIYLPRPNFDVFAAIGVSGDCELEVNFGGELFRWKEGNEWAWRVEGHVGRLNGEQARDDELPTYSEARSM